MPTTQETIGEIKQFYMKLKLEALSLRATLPADSATNEKLAEVCEKLSEAVRVLQNVPDSVPLPAIVMPTILHLTSLNKLIPQLNKDKTIASLFLRKIFGRPCPRKSAKMTRRPITFSVAAPVTNTSHASPATYLLSDGSTAA